MFSIGGRVKKGPYAAHQPVPPGPAGLQGGQKPDKGGLRGHHLCVGQRCEVSGNRGSGRHKNPEVFHPVVIRQHVHGQGAVEVLEGRTERGEKAGFRHSSLPRFRHPPRRAEYRPKGGEEGGLRRPRELCQHDRVRCSPPRLSLRPLV